ncbi:MAG: hypothetical protein JNK05_09340 [Myxococcales bacterium]|nr:hypothetical protein [Myxococcales bacterium]
MISRTLCAGGALAFALASCAPSTRCGEGTVLVSGTCVVDRDNVVVDQPSADGSPRDTRSDDVTAFDAGVTDATDPMDVATPPDVTIVDSGVTVDRPPPDSGIVDAGPLVLRADDTLLFRSATATMMPGHALCPSLTILRSDGTRIPVLPGAVTVTIVPNDSTVLEVARPGECGALGGVVALAPRATTARFTIESMGTSVSAVLGVTVLDGRVQFETGETAVVPVGGEVEYQTLRRHLLTAGGSTDVSSDVRLVQRFFVGLQSTPAGLFTIGDVDTTDGRTTLRGSVLGTGRFDGGYGPPGRVTPFDAIGTVTVVAPGTLTSVGPFFYFRDGVFVSQGAPRTLDVGECLEVRVQGNFTSGTSRYRQFVTSALALTATGDGRIESTTINRVCATARGELTVRACVGAVCSAESIATLVPGQPHPTLTLAPASITFVQRFLGAFDGCAPLRATLRYSDGATRDVTDSRATRWFAPFSGGGPPVMFYRAMNGDAPRVDASGNPCFSGGGPATRMYDFLVDVMYGNSGASPRLSVAVR